MFQSTRAPIGARDAFAAGLAWPSRCFNPRAPRLGRATVGQAGGCCAEAVSIHARPDWGARPGVVSPGGFTRKVSIHARPDWGARLVGAGAGIRFQSTRAPIGARDGLRRQRFQSTRAPIGARDRREGKPGRVSRARAVRSARKATLLFVSIHARPDWGARRNSTTLRRFQSTAQVANKNSFQSTRAPIGARDAIADDQPPCDRASFNPRAPRLGRATEDKIQRAVRRQLAQCFNPRAPRLGRATLPSMARTC
jgi:hypothetical protein